MADISQYLTAIMQAVYGEDVRGSIHDAIELINNVSEVVLSTGTAVTEPSSSSTGFYTDSLYLNTDTMELWKCIGTNAWQSQGTLKGAQGEDGSDGIGISSIEKTGTVGLVDTYTITYTDGSTDEFLVTNGADGHDGADGTNGNKWYRGTGISGKAVNPTVYATSGVTNANSGDMYLNPTEGAIYSCDLGGAPAVATWVYEMTLSGGGGGTTNYPDLENKPQINSVTLNGNQSASDLGFATVATSGNASDLNEDSTHQLVTAAQKQEWSNKQNRLTIDQAYDPTSTNPVSGTGVADALTDYYDKTEIDAQEKNLVSYGGAVTFATLPALSAANLNKFYLVTDSFTTTSDFVVGAGTLMPADSHIAIINIGTDAAPVYKYDDFGGFVDTSSLQTKIIPSMTVKGATVATVENALSAINSGLDDWVMTATVSSGTVSFSGIDDSNNYGYMPCCVITDSSTNKNPSAQISTLSGSGTSSMSVTYTTDADNGATVKLRRFK